MVNQQQIREAQRLASFAVLHRNAPAWEKQRLYAVAIEDSSLMETLFALVLTVAMTNGDYQDVILGVYDSPQECSQAATEQKVSAECWPVESILRGESRRNPSRSTNPLFNRSAWLSAGGICTSKFQEKP
jgi:hypothetical protein